MPGNSRPKERKVPLNTDDERTALIRKREVDRREPEIKVGLPVSFSWLTDTVGGGNETLTLSQARERYLNAREADRLRPATLDSYRYAITHLEQAIGEGFPVAEISASEIDTLKIKLNASLSATTLNITLRSVRTFLNWCLERNYINKVPRIRMVNVPANDPVYLSNDQFEAICVHAEDHVAEALWFFRESGCRLSEPFYGDINGNFLTIRADTAKGKRSRDVFLTSRMKKILLEMRVITHLREDAKPYSMGFGYNIQKTHEINYYSRKFKAAAMAAGITDRHLHHLRHTAAVRTYLRTRDIYEVARMLGHASVTTTEVYARFNIKRLEQDFPDLVPQCSSAQPMRVVRNDNETQGGKDRRNLFKMG